MSTFTDLFATLPTTMHAEYALKETITIPQLPQSQCIVIPLVRTSIAPMLIRNNDAELTTDLYLAGTNRIRMIASKTKGVERRRGAQILRMLGIGGFAPANKAFKAKDKPMSEVFDLNTVVFGDSAKGTDKAIYPVHAAVLYSDALSVEAVSRQIDAVFRQGGVYEDGGNFDAENQGTSSNIFTTYSVKAGTRFIQTLVLTGNRITREAFDHLILSIGLAGSYGGATAVTGTNLQTTIAGIYWGKLERPINAPSQILPHLDSNQATEDIVAIVANLFGREYPYGIEPAGVAEYVDELVMHLEQEDAVLIRQYGHGAEQAAQLFDAWFSGKSSKTEKKRRGSATAVETAE